jgi:hypothetical protein
LSLPLSPLKIAGEKDRKNGGILRGMREIEGRKGEKDEEKKPKQRETL